MGNTTRFDDMIQKSPRTVMRFRAQALTPSRGRTEKSPHVTTKGEVGGRAIARGMPPVVSTALFYYDPTE